MFVHPSLYIVVLIFAVLIYWTLPRAMWLARAIFITVVSVALVTLLMPTLGICLVLGCLAAYAYTFVRRRSGSIWLAGVFILGQVCLMLLPDFADLEPLAQGFALVGLTYFTLRNIGFVIDVYKEKTDASFADLLFLNSFFPTYSAGPIENTKTFGTRDCNVNFELSEFLVGVSRILVGILKFYFVSSVLIGGYIAAHYPGTAKGIAAAPSSVVLTLAVLGWVALYTQFSGYADIAIGSSKLFCIRVRENFNYPFLATNIQDYWQRWNISVMNFVSEYLYLNFVRQTGWRIAGIFLVFLAIGMWHRVSLGYLIWGLAHASAMTLHIVLRRQVFFQRWQEIAEHNAAIAWPSRVLGWLLTIIFVSVVSAVGTAPNFEVSQAYLKGIFLP